MSRIWVHIVDILRLPLHGYTVAAAIAPMSVLHTIQPKAGREGVIAQGLSPQSDVSFIPRNTSLPLISHWLELDHWLMLMGF